MLKVVMAPYLSAYAYHSGEHVSDYQSDMVYNGLSSLDDVSVLHYPRPWHMYKTVKEEDKNKIWGMGYSLYGLLDEKPALTFDEEEDFVKNADLIVLPLHHTMVRNQEGYYEYVDMFIKRFNRPVACIDGWDDPSFLRETAQLCPYFKRELEDESGLALPIFFGIPEEKFYFGESVKTQAFSDMIPANFSWHSEHTKDYHRYKTEESYYKQYQSSFFGYNCRKGGWATGRQNELVANQCVPYFTDIEQCPKNCLFNYPKELCIEVKKMKGVYPGTINPFNPDIDTYIGDTRQIKCGEERGHIDFDVFDVKLYNIYMQEFFNYAYMNLTTKALAKYVLEKSL